MSLPMDVVAGAVAGLGVAIFFAGVVYLRAARARARRLSAFVSAQRPALPEIEEEGAGTRGGEPRLIVAMNRRLRRGTLGERTQRELARAGVGLTASEFILIRVGAALGGAIIGLLAMPRPVSGVSLLFPLAIGLGGFFVPASFLKVKQRKRLAAFEKQLPDALDVMRGSLRAGSSLLQAMEMVSREAPPPLAEEFARAVREIGFGLPLEGALLDMVGRVDSKDLDMLVTAVSIQHRTGGNLAQIIEMIAATIRERVRVKGEIRVLTAQQRLSAYIISVMPIGVGVVLFMINRPYMVKLFEPGITRCLAVWAGVSMVLGFFALRRITAIEV